jgi:retinol dehydrogenase 12
MYNQYEVTNVSLQGASTTCYVAIIQQIEGVNGKYFTDCNESNCSSLANNKSEAKKLWNNTNTLLHEQLMACLD